MKKLSITVFCALLLLVGGCSDANTNVSDKNETIMTVDGSKITKGDLYAGLANKGNVTPITNAIGAQVVKKAVPVNKDIEKEAKATLASTKESVGADKWDDYVKSNGFKDEEDYYKNSVLLNTRLGKVTETYVAKNFTKLAKEYEARKLQIMVVSDKDKAANAIKDLKDKKDFIETTKTFGDTTKYNGSEGVYTNQSGLPTVVWTNLLKLEDGKYFEKAIKDDATGSYYIVKVVSSNAKKSFKNDAVNAIKNISATNEEGLTIADVAFQYYLGEIGYSIHDAGLYSALLSNSIKYKEV